MNPVQIPMQSEYDYSLYYRHWHDESDRYAEQMAAAHCYQLQPLIQASQTDPAIDIGCGMGFAILALQKLGFTSVTGIDTDTQQIKACKKRGLAVEQVSNTIAYLDQFPNRFGLVLMLDVLEHIPVKQQIAVIRSIHASLKPGGQLILQVPNANSLMGVRTRYMDFTHCSTFTEHSLRFVLLNSGFSQVDIGDAHPAKRPSLRLWKQIARQRMIQFLHRSIVRALWRQVLTAEFGESAKQIPIDINLRAIAFKELTQV
ncbi:class I SAM-dependent methyltransferase [Leptolyngbya sp. NIES-2104]|uniref:class I SAM-dependent methyltransferase n=1 Tax=Leptolyngbya sp. NIES-2104 TaxID=1552121 RepID=UPI0006EC68BC|nr:class I SAM-dependent methyltransferase [Leptolyngbya sp. NIES-2104]GAP95138.1 methyltransferase type 11 [Leptolyngbya sp. NIES-2104]